MSTTSLRYFINIGLKTVGEVANFRQLRTIYSEAESIKIITMQRG